MRPVFGRRVGPLLPVIVAVSTLSVSAPAAEASSSFTTITWSTAAPSPIARHEAQGAVVGEKLYVLSGYISRDPWVATVRSDVYDAATNTWTRIRDIPQGTTHAGAATEGTNIYLAGGYINKDGGGQIFATRAVWKYDTVLDGWSSMPPLPAARGAGALAVLDGKLHFFGGSTRRRVESGAHYVLDLTAGTSWTTSPAVLPNPRHHLGAAVLDGKIYAVGGQQGKEPNVVTQKSVHVWDPANPDQWTTATDLPTARSHISAATFTMDGRILVVAGMDVFPGSTDDVTAYDPVSDSWTELTPLPVSRHSGVGASIGGRIFYTTGRFKTTTYKGTPGA